MKFNSAYPSLLGGVSQRPPGLRRADQHWEQVNLIADAVRGLTRRQGSVLLDYEASSATNVSATLADADQFETVDLKVVDTEIAVAYRKGAKPTGSALSVIHAYDKNSGSIFPIVRKGTDPDLDLLEAGGVSAAVALGRFLLLAGNTMTPTYSRTDKWAPATNQKLHTVWVRGGAYSRTFGFAMIRGNQKFWITYTTRSASYPDPLDTSDLLPTDPDYTKKVTDRTNEYNSRALKWAGEALADATPENIATRLAERLRSSGFLSTSGTVTVSGSTVCITDDSVEDVEVDDGGDGSLMRCAGNVVTAPELLTSVGYPGKVVKVRPTNTLNNVEFYVEAVAKDKSTGAFTAVTWEEAAGVEFAVTRAFAFGTIDDGTLYLSTDLAWLETQTGVTFPRYEVSQCGDDTTNEPPEFLKDGRITMLGVFQDRLVIGAGGAVNTSRTGDYLNFFPASLLEVDATDPVNFGIIGGEDDTLLRSLVYDRSLILVGKKRQYVVNGRVPFVPGGNSQATIFAPIPDSGDVQPVAAGNFMFFAKSAGGSVSLHQLQPGQIEQSPFTQELTQDLDTYIGGTARALVACTTPDTVLLRADARSSLYVYQFSDVGNKRSLSAWNRWDLSGPTGSSGAIVSISLADEAVLVLRYINAASPYLTVERIALTGAEGQHPYLDLATQTTPPAGLYTAAQGAYSALGKAGSYQGCRMDVGTAPGGWWGFLMTGYVALTSPMMKAQEGIGMIAGELTVNALKVQLADTAGVVYRVDTKHGDPVTMAYAGLPPAIYEDYDPKVGDCDCEAATPPTDGTLTTTPPDLCQHDNILIAPTDDAPSDEFYAQAALILNFEDGVADASPAARAMVLTGTGAITATRARYGTKSYENTAVNSTAGYESAATFSVASATTTGLTLECDVYWTGSGTRETILSIPGVLDINVKADGTLNYTGNGSADTAAGVIPANTWTHIAVSIGPYNGVHHPIALYVNGVVGLGGSSGPQWYVNFSNKAVVVGRGTYNSFRGSIDRVRVATAYRYPEGFRVAPHALPETGTRTLRDTSCFVTKTLTLSGEATTSPAEKPFGTRSVWIPNLPSGNNTTNGITVTGSSEFAFGTGDFSMRWWVYRTDNSRANALLYGTVSGQTFYMEVEQGGNRLLGTYATSAGVDNWGPVGAPTIALNTWTQVLLQRRGNNLELWLNGTLAMTRAISGGSGTSINFTGDLYLGRRNVASPAALAGYLAAIGAVKGTALATATFTPGTPGPLLANPQATPGKDGYVVATIDFQAKTVDPTVGAGGFPDPQTDRTDGPTPPPNLLSWLTTGGTTIDANTQTYGLGVGGSLPVTALRPVGGFAQSNALRRNVRLYIPVPVGEFVFTIEADFGTPEGTIYPPGHVLLNVGPTKYTGTRIRVSWATWDSSFGWPRVSITREAVPAAVLGGFCLPGYPVAVPCEDEAVVGPAPSAYATPLPWGNTPPVFGLEAANAAHDLDDYDLASLDPTTDVVITTAPRRKARLTVPVAEDANSYTATLATYLWTPLSITGVEFDGQFFQQTRRL